MPRRPLVNNAAPVGRRTLEEDQAVAAPAPKSKAAVGWDYKGFRMIVMPSGLTMVYAGATYSEGLSKMHCVHEGRDLKEATRWADHFLKLDRDTKSLAP
jgi:hypothetical protein